MFTLNLRIGLFFIFEFHKEIFLSSRFLFISSSKSSMWYSDSMPSVNSTLSFFLLIKALFIFSLWFKSEGSYNLWPVFLSNNCWLLTLSRNQRGCNSMFFFYKETKIFFLFFATPIFMREAYPSSKILRICRLSGLDIVLRNDFLCNSV